MSNVGHSNVVCICICVCVLLDWLVGVWSGTLKELVHCQNKGTKIRYEEKRRS